MFIFAKNTKEIVVTAGAVVACLALTYVAARSVYNGGFELITAMICVPIIVAICKGEKLGYQIARIFFCVFVVLVGTLPINPMAYGDFLGSKDEYWAFMLSTGRLVAIGFIAFFSLGEHAKLRGLT